MYISKISSSLNQTKTNQTVSFRENSKKSIKVSIILPIYNQEKYLEKALASLQKQTLQDIEIICVNDGSKDNSLNILKRYAQQDHRIRIIDQNNQGCGQARNNGLKVAQGEFIAFLDPDDWIEPNALELLYTQSKKQNCEMMVFNFNKINEAGEVIQNFNLKKRLQRFYNINENENFHWRDIKPKVLGGLYPVAWNKFYKRNLIVDNQIHFANSNLAEDNAFVFGATLSSEKIGYLDKCLYHYLIHEKSAIRTKSDRNFCIFRSIDSVKQLLKKLNLTEELKKEFDNYILRIVSFHIKQIKSISKFKEVCKKRLSSKQNQMLNQRYCANSKIMPIIDSLLAHKTKIKI